MYKKIRRFIRGRVERTTQTRESLLHVTCLERRHVRRLCLLGADQAANEGACGLMCAACIGPIAKM